MAEPTAAQAVAELVVQNWHWLAAGAGTLITGAFGLAYRCVRAVIDWGKPKLENIYSKHMELVTNLNLVIPGMSQQLAQIEKRQTESDIKLVEVHRLITADEEWDRESARERERQK